MIDGCVEFLWAHMLSDILLLLGLILLNGVFALSEIAIVSSRRARLAHLADGGSVGARHALALAAEPTRFLSSVQVGITTIGILNGAIGEFAIAVRLQVFFERVPSVAAHAESLSLGIMVVLLTYASLILGELVPKRLALTHPERVASVIARPMEILAIVARPLVYLLSVSTDAIVRCFGVRHVKRPGVTADEIRVMLEQGAEEGVFERAEHDMMTNVLNLDERYVGSVLTPPAEVVYLDVQQSLDANCETLRTSPHSVLPLCHGGLDRVVGFVRSTRVLDQILGGVPLDLAALAEQPLFVPETMTLMKLLEQFKRMHLPLALVIDEFGAVQGLVSLTDVVSSIVGDRPTAPGEEPSIVRRDDGTWLLDGALDLDSVLRALGAEASLSDGDRRYYHTLGGLAMLALGRVPRTGDVFEKGGYRFEIVDMDGNRVDRVLASEIRPEGETGS
jgi:magnesium and cobalt exporter, CNNM family